MKARSSSLPRASGAAFATSLLASALLAQPLPPAVDAVELEEDDEIEAVVTVGYVDKTEFKGDRSSGAFAEKAGGVEFQLELEKEVELTDVSSFSAGIEFQTREFGTKTSDNLPVPERLQSLAVELGYTRRFDDKWSARFSAAPGLYSAGSGFGSDSFGVEVGAIAIYEFSPTLRVGFGLGADVPSKGDSSLSPRLLLEWLPAEAWAVRVGYPATEIAYTVSEGLELAFQITGEPFGDTYYVEDDPAPGLAGKPSLRDSAVEYSDLRLGLAARFELPGGFDLEAAVGYVVNQEFEYTETGGRDYTVESDGGAAFFTISARYDF